MSYFSLVQACPDIKMSWRKFGSIFVADASAAARGPQEDKCLIRNPVSRSLVRRGLSFVSLDGKNIRPLRVGLSKFFYMESIDLNSIHQKANLNSPLSQEELYASFVHDHCAAAFSRNAAVRMVYTFKENGANAQIGYCKEIDRWVVCSKNVSIFMRDDGVIDYPSSNLAAVTGNDGDYSFTVKSDESGELRESFARANAVIWHRILKTRVSTPEALKSLKESLQNMTLTGEAVGLKQQKHICDRLNENLVFFGLMRFNQITPEALAHGFNKKGDHGEFLAGPLEIGRPFPEVIDFCKQHNLDIVRNNVTGEFHSMDELIAGLRKLEDDVRQQDLVSGGEGAVVRFESSDGHLLAMVKLKTLEYVWMRRARERSKTAIACLPIMNNNKSKQNSKEKQIHEVVEKLAGEARMDAREWFEDNRLEEIHHRIIRLNFIYASTLVTLFSMAERGSNKFRSQLAGDVSNFFIDYWRSNADVVDDRWSARAFALKAKEDKWCIVAEKRKGENDMDALRRISEGLKPMEHNIDIVVNHNTNDMPFTMYLQSLTHPKVIEHMYDDENNEVIRCEPNLRQNDDQIDDSDDSYSIYKIPLVFGSADNINDCVAAYANASTENHACKSMPLIILSSGKPAIDSPLNRYLNNPNINSIGRVVHSSVSLIDALQSYEKSMSDKFNESLEIASKMADRDLDSRAVTDRRKLKGFIDSNKNLAPIKIVCVFPMSMSGSGKSTIAMAIVKNRFKELPPDAINGLTPRLIHSEIKARDDESIDIDVLGFVSSDGTLAQHGKYNATNLNIARDEFNSFSGKFFDHLISLVNNTNEITLGRRVNSVNALYILDKNFIPDSIAKAVQDVQSAADSSILNGPTGLRIRLFNCGGMLCPILPAPSWQMTDLTPYESVFRAILRVGHPTVDGPESAIKVVFGFASTFAKNRFSYLPAKLSELGMDSTLPIPLGNGVFASRYILEDPYDLFHDLPQEKELMKLVDDIFHKASLNNNIIHEANSFKDHASSIWAEIPKAFASIPAHLAASTKLLIDEAHRLDENYNNVLTSILKGLQTPLCDLEGNAITNANSLISLNIKLKARRFVVAFDNLMSGEGRDTSFFHPMSFVDTKHHNDARMISKPHMAHATVSTTATVAPTSKSENKKRKLHESNAIVSSQHHGFDAKPTKSFGSWEVSNGLTQSLVDNAFDILVQHAQVVAPHEGNRMVNDVSARLSKNPTSHVTSLFWGRNMALGSLSRSFVGSRSTFKPVSVLFWTGGLVAVSVKYENDGSAPLRFLSNGGTFDVSRMKVDQVLKENPDVQNGILVDSKRRCFHITARLAPGVAPVMSGTLMCEMNKISGKALFVEANGNYYRSNDAPVTVVDDVMGETAFIVYLDEDNTNNIYGEFNF